MKLLTQFVEALLRSCRVRESARWQNCGKMWQSSGEIEKKLSNFRQLVPAPGSRSHAQLAMSSRDATAIETIQTTPPSATEGAGTVRELIQRYEDEARRPA